MFFSAVNAEGIGGAVVCENGIEKFRIGLNFRPLGAAKTLLKAVEGWMLFEGHSVAELVPWALSGFWRAAAADMGFRPRPGDQCPTGVMKKDLHGPPLGLPRGPVVEREVAINNAADQGWFCFFVRLICALSAFFLLFPVNCVRASVAPEVGAEGSWESLVNFDFSFFRPFLNYR